MSLNLSIIVPMYKSEWCIADCITSLYHQDLSLDEYEVIAVDNGSPDGCADYIRSLQKQYTNLQLISLPINRLPSGARNAGLDAAKGKYIMFVDSDDMLKPDVLKHLIGEIEQDNLDFVHFECDYLEHDTIINHSPSMDSAIMSGVELYFSNLMSSSNKRVTWNKVYSRSFLVYNHIRCNENLLYEDDEFSYKVFVMAQRVCHLDYAPYVYRYNAMSATQNKQSIHSILSDIKEIRVIHSDIKLFKHKKYDSRLLKEMELYLRWLIVNALGTYQKREGTEKQILKQLLKENIDWCCLPYMSKKKFILLKLGII